MDDDRDSLTLSRMLSGLPAPRPESEARSLLARSLEDTQSFLVVADDDPTGTQTVHGVPVLLRWSDSLLSEAVAAGERVIYVSTNSRSLPASEAALLARDLGQSISRVSQGCGARMIVASRSDSTLRGHFPAEVDGLIRGMGGVVDGVVLVPAFFEGGRYTVGNTHWVEQEGLLVPAGETEFARDPTFGYTESDLPAWVEEKTAGRVRSTDVCCLGLGLIREGGAAAVARELEEWVVDS